MPRKAQDAPDPAEEAIDSGITEIMEEPPEADPPAEESLGAETIPAVSEETGEEPPEQKPKRSRKKNTDAAPPEPPPQEDSLSDVQEKTPESDMPPKKPRPDPILTLEVGAEVETEERAADIAWHEIHNAYRTRRILTGILGGLEQTDNGKTLAIVEYKGFRVVIPLKEMVMNLPNDLSGKEYGNMIIRQHKLLSNMLGAEIDFIVKGIDSKTRSIVASRKDAMLRKRKLFYMDEDENGFYRIYDGRVVQARVIAVAEKAIRIEAFGVECSIMARDLSWDWIGDAHDRFSVGDQILVRVLTVNRSDIESLSIKADVKSVSENRQNNLDKCRVQSKYVGKVTDVHKGVVFIRLTNGVNAIAHSCYDRRMPGKKDDVSFAVTNIDEERGVALGIITRIIKQNL